MKKKILLILSGLFLSFILLELGLRVAGFTYLYLQEQGNKQSLKKKDTYKIMCLGESTTQNQYPKLLETELNNRNTGIKFSVIDKGRGAMVTNVILARLKDDLDEYKPDMVITMMGINDRRDDVIAYEVEEAGVSFRKLKTYRLMKLISLHFQSKVGEIKNAAGGIAEKAGEGINPKSKLSESDGGAVNTVADKGSQYVDKGFHCSNTGNYKEAEKMYMKAIDENRNNVQAYLCLADLYKNEGRYKEDEIMSEKAIRLNPKNEQGYVRLGDCYAVQERYSEAEKLYRKAVGLNPKDEAVYLNIGEFYRKQNRYKEAEEIYKKLIELNPKNEQRYVNLGTLYDEQGRHKDAEETFKKVIERDPKNEQGNIGLGNCYWLQKRIEEGVEQDKKVIELNPKNEQGYIMLADCYVMQKKYEEAEALYMKAMELNPKLARTYYSLSTLYTSQKRFEDGARILKEGMKQEGKSNAVADGDIRNTIAKGFKDEGVEYKKIKDGTQSFYFGSVTVYNYKRLRKILKERNITYVCMQYPMREIADLKSMFNGDKDIVFVDNESVFKDAVQRGGYSVYFHDKFGGNFGHCTPKGNRLLAANIADTIIKEVFHK